MDLEERGIVIRHDGVISCRMCLYLSAGKCLTPKSRSARSVPGKFRTIPQAPPGLAERHAPPIPAQRVGRH